VLAAPDLTGVVAWSRSDAHRSSPCYDLLASPYFFSCASSLAGRDLSNGNATLKTLVLPRFNSA